MKTQELTLPLGTIRPQQSDAPALAAGWYWDINRGIAVYYDPNSQRFYTLQSGILVPLANWNTPPKQVSLAPGDKLQMTLAFQYIGPAVTGVLTRFSIGVKGAFGYTEYLAGTPSFNIPANLTGTPTEVTCSNTFNIPSNVGSDWDDVHVKIWGGTPNLGGSEQLPAYEFGFENALLIVSAQPSITEFKIKDFVKV